MKNINKISEQVILLFVAVEEEDIKQNSEVNTVNYKKQNEVDEFTEIWELVKK